MTVIFYYSTSDPSHVNNEAYETANPILDDIVDEEKRKIEEDSRKAHL